MKVSVIIPAYNIERYISRCIESITNQTLKNIEIIIVNDGSTDNTLNEINELKKKDNRILIISQDNQGSIEAKKNGLNIAKGEYVIFVDGDDWLELNTLELLYNNAKLNGSDIVIYNAFVAYDEKKEILLCYNDLKMKGNDYIEGLFLGYILPGMWCKFIRKDFIKENNIVFPSNISYAEDLATSVSWFLNNPKITVVNSSLYNYYYRENSITKTKSNKVLEIDKAISFMEKILIEYDRYEEYLDSFEYMVYKHLFRINFLKYSDIDEINYELYYQYKNRNISIKSNKYIREEINKYPISLRVRVESYNKKYIYGKIYDKFRDIAKLKF